MLCEGATAGLYTSACTSECAAGYYCPEASWSPYAFECATVLPAALSGSPAAGAGAGAVRAGYNAAVGDGSNTTLWMQGAANTGYIRQAS